MWLATALVGYATKTGRPPTVRGRSTTERECTPTVRGRRCKKGVSMVSESELEGFRRERYFSRAWALLTRDRGWIKPVLVMSVALLVPIAGILGVMGYVFEWARLTAWGVNSAPRQRGVRVGACISSGWCAFVVGLVWGILSSIVMGIVAIVPVIGWIVSALWGLITAFLAIVVMVAGLRATIYQKIRPGLRASTIWKMVSHDPGGLVRIFLIELIGGALIGMVSTVVVIVALFGVLPQVIYYAEYVMAYESVLSADMQAALVAQLVFSVLSALGPAAVVLIVVGNIMTVILYMVVATAVGLWMRQFNVPAWGRDEDPLPPFVDADEKDADSQAQHQEEVPVPGLGPVVDEVDAAPETVGPAVGTVDATEADPAADTAAAETDEPIEAVDAGPAVGADTVDPVVGADGEPETTPVDGDTAGPVVNAEPDANADPVDAAGPEDATGPDTTN